MKTLLKPKTKVAASVTAKKKIVPIIETNKGVVLIKIDLLLSLNIGVSTKFMYLYVLYQFTVKLHKSLRAETFDSGAFRAF